MTRFLHSRDSLDQFLLLCPAKNQEILLHVYLHYIFIFIHHMIKKETYRNEQTDSRQTKYKITQKCLSVCTYIYIYIYMRQADLTLLDQVVCTGHSL